MPEKVKGYSAYEWMIAFLDLLDGNAAPHEIKNITGLSDERCEELSSMFYDGIKDGWPKEEAG